MIDWSKALEAIDAVQPVIYRAEEELGLSRKDSQTVMMDLCACNVHCPLDFDRLMSFPRFDFAHDINGINEHLDRDTGELKDCFLPRCAKPVPSVEDKDEEAEGIVSAILDRPDTDNYAADFLQSMTEEPPL